MLENLNQAYLEQFIAGNPSPTGNRFGHHPHLDDLLHPGRAEDVVSGGVAGLVDDGAVSRDDHVRRDLSGKMQGQRLTYDRDDNQGKVPMEAAVTDSKNMTSYVPVQPQS